MQELTITPDVSEYLTDEEILDAARAALTMPSDSMWWDRDMFSTHSSVFSAPDPELTDDYLAQYSNYRVALNELSFYHPDDVEESSFGHWTYSRFVCIKIRVVTDDGVITPAFIRALELDRGLEEYPLLDESDYSELVQEVNDAYIERRFNEDVADELIPDGVTVDDMHQAMWSLSIYIEETGWLSDDDWATLRERAEWEAQERRSRAHGAVHMF